MDNFKCRVLPHEYRKLDVNIAIENEKENFVRLSICTYCHHIKKEECPGCFDPHCGEPKPTDNKFDPDLTRITLDYLDRLSEAIKKRSR